MSEIELFPFQAKAADQIAERYVELVNDDGRPWERKDVAVPYYQALAALTGAGKTPVLADAVSQIRANCTVEPVVLWISKARAVVEQTMGNFQGGGKYAHLLPEFLVTRLSQVTTDHIADGSSPLLLMATVGTFNQKDKEDGSLRIHKKAEDRVDSSLWATLRTRLAGNTERRPLIIVYDEAHNLSPQQSDLLLELEPDAILLASATMTVGGRMGRVVDRLQDYGWGEDKLVTEIKSKKVVRAGLVKDRIVLGGYATLMESALDDMLSEYQTVCEKAEQLDAGFTPKAIYVCRTNISQDDGQKDNHQRPFKERRAPPILIWRYLVERKGIDPSEIAVYCDLKMDHKHNPPPKDFVLFSGGEDDFAAFSAGRYRHIIFNQSLEEGWDDPQCCFAYIDKSMGSKVKVLQVIGRVLRQPNARHYSDPNLNTAQFFIRIDSKQAFPDILEEVRRKIAADSPEVELDSYTDPRERERMLMEPKEEMEVPEVHIDATEAISVEADGTAVGPFADALGELIDYRDGKAENITGKGELIRAEQKIGDSSPGSVITTETAHSNAVMARWIVRRTVQSLYPRVASAIDWSNPKFDAKVEITSPAAVSLRDSAKKLVETYLEHSDLAYEEYNPFVVGPVYVNPKRIIDFKNALHEGYSGLNELELSFAREIDATGLTWCRNPASSGYSIPLLQIGDVFNFFPDFLVWKNGIIYVLEPKGEHLIGKAAGSKLLNIRDEKSKQRLVVRLFTKGKWTDPNGKAIPGGITMWALKAGQVKPRHFPSVEKAIEAVLI